MIQETMKNLYEKAHRLTYGFIPCKTIVGGDALAMISPRENFAVYVKFFEGSGSEVCSVGTVDHDANVRFVKRISEANLYMTKARFALERELHKETKKCEQYD